jgi:hypothetical protein
MKDEVTDVMVNEHVKTETCFNQKYRSFATVVNTCTNGVRHLFDEQHSNVSFPATRGHTDYQIFHFRLFHQFGLRGSTEISTTILFLSSSKKNRT